MNGNALAATGLVCSLAAGSLAADFPRAEISNGLIHAVLYLPDAQHGYYRGTRFDWSGVIASLEYNGHNYYGPWFQRMDPKVHDFVYDGPDIVAGPASAISGPVEEFSSGGSTLGYDEAKPGGTFLKIGVGGLRKPDEPGYDHYEAYEVVDPGKWSVRKGPDWVEFAQEVNGPAGYAYVYRKTIRLAKDKPEMTLQHSLKNTGHRRIEADVYNHNFLVLDRQPTGPDFEIAFPFQIRSERPPNKELAEIRGNKIVYLKNLVNKDTVATGVEGFGGGSQDYDIRIENRRAGAGMRITADRPLLRAALWSIRSVVAVEPYLGMAIEPGGEYTWTLTYDFYSINRN
ncbi:MAG: hypothetical protein ABSH45_09095 [Bryobacteraceae bacterium]|jgi:hypothetical protein